MKRSLYSRPDKPRTMAVKQRRGAPDLALPSPTEIVTVDGVTECHVTPPAVAGRMVAYLGPTHGCLTLEPEAGTGNLIQALFDAGYAASELVAVERHAGLCAAIRRRFDGDRQVRLINGCFLEYAAAAQGGVAFGRIVMNPSFRAVKKHVDAALTLLDRDGPSGTTLVALVPITYRHGDAETLEELPPDTFPTAAVYTKIIRFDE